MSFLNNRLGAFYFLKDFRMFGYIKRLLVVPVFLMMFGMVSCAGSLQTGDIVFVGLRGDSGILWVHTAIVDMMDGKPMVIDATMFHGVDRHPLDTLLNDFRRHDGTYPEFKVMRLKDTSDAQEFVDNAKQFIGEEYDTELVPGNGRHYCTELVQDSYIREGNLLFPLETLDFNDPDGTVNRYWQKLFNTLGTEVPNGLPGTLPNPMIQSDFLEPVDIDIFDFSAIHPITD